MKAKCKTTVTVMNCVCAMLMIALIVLQFVPFWTYGEQDDQTASVASYVWFPDRYKELDKHFQTAVGDTYTINQIVLMPVLTLFLGAVGSVLCIVWRKSAMTGLLPACCGAVGMWGYLSKAVFRLGAGWQLHLAVCIALVLAGACVLISGLAEGKR